MIKYIPQLKADAVPTKALPNEPSASETDPLSDSDADFKDVATQTTNERQTNSATVTPRKRKLHCEFVDHDKLKDKLN